MSEELNNQVSLRKYLLGLLDEAQTKEVEESLVSNKEYFQEFQIVEAEIIQDFVDETLSLEEKKAFEENFIITEDRREQINFARALRKFVDEKPKPQLVEKPSFFELLKSLLLSPIPAAAIVLLVVGISIFVWWNYSQKSEVLVALNKSQKNERPTEARITDFDYAPKTEGTRGNNNTENLDLVFAKSRATEAVLKNPTAENYHELGRVYLAEKGFDEAIKQFEKAIKLNPNISKLNNDLGVALMEKGRLKEEGRLELFARANESIEKSIELDKNLKEAYFNRALIIELLNLPNQAKEAWENYLKLDSTSKWADEARQRLQKLEANKPISKTKEDVLREFLEAKEANDKEKAWQTLSRNREMITGKLIPQQLAFLFVDSKVKGDESEAKKALDALMYVGKLEEEKSGDLFWRDLANYYKNVSDEKISDLKKAQDSIRNGYELIKKDKYKDAEREFNNATLMFSKHNNIWEENFSKYWVSYLLFQNDKIEKSNQILYEIAKFSENKSYLWLASHTNFWLAVNSSTLKKFSKSIEYDKKAIKYAEETSELYNLQKSYSQIANHYQQVGHFTKSLNYAQKSLKLGELPEASFRQKWRDYDAVSDILTKKKLSKTSELFKKEALRLAIELSDADVFKWSSYTDLAVMYGNQFRYSEAFDLLSEGRKIAENFDDENRRRNIAYINLQTGHLNRQRSKCAEAIENYNSTIEFYRVAENVIDEFEARKGRLICYLANKNDDAFQTELPIILNLFNKYRAEILEEQNRNNFFGNEQDVYDIAIDYEFNKSNFINAFDYSEESRARSLLDLQNTKVEILTEDNQPEIRFSTNVTKPLRLAKIQTEMPENVQLLQYTILDNKILIWLITKNNLTVEKVEISSENLNEKVLTYIDLISRNSEIDEQRKLSTELYQILIAPAKEKLDVNKELFIIPDKVLFRLPFATLFSGKYLIEDYKISYAPSANVFLYCSRKAKELETKSLEIILSIGNPTFNSTSFENLHPLSSAKLEAQEVAKNYEKSIVFTEKEATKETIQENLSKADVIHFAGHYVVDEQSPLLSGLVLAGNEKEGSTLANHEIISEKLSHTRLIVLSACQTGIEKYYNSEGMIGASRTFLATGIPIVVASQWQVDSEATTKLMIDFHYQRKIKELSTTNALRQAQLEMIRNEKYSQPYYWAAFVTFGGYTNF